MNKRKSIAFIPVGLREQNLILQQQVKSLEAELMKAKKHSLVLARSEQLLLTEDELKMIYAQF
ncbi:hypothetical protein [Shewanella woodyi]|uniref:hypothetical protein n=1 Tax=Shewanella woodyi TaxID=60961 RepID=UPI0007F92A92|nr:hypothetical protein [Shewanella woodyi]